MERSAARLMAVASVVLLLTVPLAAALVNPRDPWAQTAKVRDGNPEAEDEFGATVAVDGDTLVVGHPLEDNESANVGFNVGAVTVYERVGGAWVEVAEFVGDEPRSRFGSTIALDGDTFVTNAPGQVMTDATRGWCPFSTAQLYTYQRVDGDWERVETLQVPGHEPHNSCLGSEVDDRALSLEAGTIAAGAPWSHGEAYIWERGSDEWSLVATFTGPNQTKWQWYGISVDVGLDGSLVAVGHPAEDVNYLYGRTPAGWALEESVSHLPGFGGGHGVEIGGDGTILADQSTHITKNQPVFIHEKEASAWTSTVLWPWDANDFNPLISDVDFDEDGDTLAVGTWVDDIAPSVAPELRDEIPIGLGVIRTGAAPEQVVSPFGDGAVYIFREAQKGSWEQTAKIQQADDVGMDFFGWDVALDQGTLAVGAPGQKAPPDDVEGYVQDPNQLVHDAYFDCCHGVVYTYTESDAASSLGPQVLGGGSS